MNRRQLIKLLSGAALFSFFPKALKAFPLSSGKQPNGGYFLIQNGDASKNDSLLERADVVLSRRDTSWRDKLITWDVRSDAPAVKDFISQYGRNTKSFSWPILIAIPAEVSSTSSPQAPDVEIWTTEWLKHATTFQHVCYPVSDSSGWWSVEGDWNPTLAEVRDHLFYSPNHASGHFQLPWLSLLLFGELQSLHSDHHEEMIGQGHVTWQDVNAECPAAQPNEVIR